MRMEYYERTGKNTITLLRKGRPDLDDFNVT